MAIQPAHTTSPSAVPSRSAALPARLFPLLAVVRWELRRIVGSRATWVLAPGAFVAFVLLMWLSLRGAELTRSADAFTGAFERASLIGLAEWLPPTVLCLGVVLPFLTTDGVIRDLSRRTHELLMTSTLPTWAYVWGRYLVGLLFGVGLAGALLLAALVTTLGLHLAHGDTYPALNLLGIVAIWAVFALPPTILLSSLSFTLGTLLPRRSNPIKLGILLAWVLSGLALPQWILQGHLPHWVVSAYPTWDPTGVAAARALHDQFQALLQRLLARSSLSDQAVLQQARALQQHMPNLAPWVGPHLAWAALGVATVMVAALAFRRFGNALS
jgi:ABC-type transport system involved in multi-copper enzyme maturation permease subunit